MGKRLLLGHLLLNFNILCFCYLGRTCLERIQSSEALVETEIVTNGVLPGNSDVLLKVWEPFLDKLINVIETHGVRGTREDGDHDQLLVAEHRLGVGVTILKRIKVHDLSFHLVIFVITVPGIDHWGNYELVDVLVQRGGKGRFKFLRQEIVQKVFLRT